MNHRLLRFLPILLVCFLVLGARCQKQTNRDLNTYDKPVGRIDEQQRNKHIKERSNNHSAKYHAKSGKQYKRSTENPVNGQLKQGSNLISD